LPWWFIQKIVIPSLGFEPLTRGTVSKRATPPQGMHLFEIKLKSIYKYIMWKVNFNFATWSIKLCLKLKTKFLRLCKKTPALFQNFWNFVIELNLKVYNLFINFASYKKLLDQTEDLIASFRHLIACWFFSDFTGLSYKSSEVVKIQMYHRDITKMSLGEIILAKNAFLTNLLLKVQLHWRSVKTS
jgi:hypothetical protein